MISSLNAGPFTNSNSNRFLDFDIPAGHLIDMSQTFVQLECSFTPTAELHPDTNEVVNLCLRHKTVTEFTPMNVDLVRNAWLNSQKKGKLEDIRKVNILRHNLMELEKSSTTKLSSTDSLSSVRTFDNLILMSGFTQLQKVGEVNSSYTNNFLRIPLSHLFELGKATVLDTNKLGVCRVHLELDDLKTWNVEYVNNVDVTAPTANPAITQKMFNNLAPAAGGNVFISQITYDTLERSPWYIGMKVTLSASQATVEAPTVPVGAATISTSLIQSIEYDSLTGQVGITLVTGLAPAADGSLWMQITLTPIDYTEFNDNNKFNILQANLGIAYNDVVSSTKASRVGAEMMQYLTWTTEEFTVDNQFMHKIFEIEPNACNAIMMFQDDAVKNILSNNDNVRSYRMRCDNVDIYDRDINVNNRIVAEYVVHDPLHYDSINRTFLNANLSLKNLNMAGFTRTEHAQKSMLGKAENSILIVATPLPVTVNSKKVQFDITCKDETKIQNVILYKQIIKSINLN